MDCYPYPNVSIKCMEFDYNVVLKLEVMCHHCLLILVNYEVNILTPGPSKFHLKTDL